MRVYYKEICPILKVGIMEDFPNVTIELRSLGGPWNICWEELGKEQSKKREQQIQKPWGRKEIMYFW